MHGPCRQKESAISLPFDSVLEVGLQRRLTLELLLLMVGIALLFLGFSRKWIMPDEPIFVDEAFKALAAVLLAIPVFARSVWCLLGDVRGKNADQLVAVAVMAAMAAGEFSTAAFVLILLRFGHFCEERSVLGAQAAIKGLKRLHAHNATVLTEVGEVEIDPVKLRSGDTLIVRPGEMIAADGAVLAGESLVDESSVTGEAAAKEIIKGCRVYAGTLNLSGMLRLHVEQAGEETAIGKISALLQQATSSKAPVVVLLERYASVFVPMTLMLAAIVLFTTRDLSRAITVLIVSCPGAFVLAGPSAMVGALAAASRFGILIKNAKFLERMSDIDTIFFDKTGTLTGGELMVSAVVPLIGTADELFQQAILCAAGSKHPAARAVLAAATAKQILPQMTPNKTFELFGKGMVAHAGEQCLRLGKRSWLEECGVKMPCSTVPTSSVVWFARDQIAVGYFLLGDQIRDNARQIMARLRSQGITRTILVTGDEWEPAHFVASRLDIDEVMARVLPEDKLNLVRREKSNGRSIMVVGDGVNDALALAAGDIGVAMGAMAADVALHSADIALLTGDLDRLPLTMELSRRTRTTINQNVLASAVTSVVMILLAASGVLSPLWGAILHNVGEIFVILNSGRLLRFDEKAPSGLKVPSLCVQPSSP